MKCASWVIITSDRSSLYTKTQQKYKTFKKHQSLQMFTLVIHTPHGIFQKVVDISYLKTICIINVTILWRNRISRSFYSLNV